MECFQVKTLLLKINISFVVFHSHLSPLNCPKEWTKQALMWHTLSPLSSELSLDRYKEWKMLTFSSISQGFIQEDEYVTNPEARKVLRLSQRTWLPRIWNLLNLYVHEIYCQIKYRCPFEYTGIDNVHTYVPSILIDSYFQSLKSISKVHELTSSCCVELLLEKGYSPLLGYCSRKQCHLK